MGCVLCTYPTSVMCTFSRHGLHHIEEQKRYKELGGSTCSSKKDLSAKKSHLILEIPSDVNGSRSKD